MNWIRNLTVVLVAFLLSFLMAECIARVILGNPEIVDSNSRRIDKNFGYKVNVTFPGIDENGFRNNPQKREIYSIAAIGDSHTYGYNVEDFATWPALLELITEKHVYNFGIGGNGIYSYHYLITNELKKKKKVLLGLYIPNDFASAGSLCDINFKNEFWSQEIERLKLNIEGCSVGQFNEPRSTSYINTKLFLLSKKSTVLVLIKRYFYKPLRKLWYQPNVNYLAIGEGLRPISYSSLIAHKANTDLLQKNIRTSYEDFEAMLNDWRENSVPGQLGIILIPSRAMVYRTVLEILKIIDEKPNQKQLLEFTENELNLEKALLALISGLKVPVLSAKTAVAEALASELRADRIENFYPDGGHPSYNGYKAYADVAAQLLILMEAQGL